MRKYFMVVLMFVSLTINGQTAGWTATYYGKYKGHALKKTRHTANGDVFDVNAMTCAAPKKFKFGTKLKITNLENNKSVIVRVNDRGRFGNHVIDLTYGAFKRIADHKDGRIKIKVKVVK